MYKSVDLCRAYVFLCYLWAYMKINGTHKRIAKLMVEEREKRKLTRNQVVKATGIHGRLIKSIEDGDGYNITTLCLLLS
jgi:hypothetical protein